VGISVAILSALQNEAAGSRDLRAICPGKYMRKAPRAHFVFGLCLSVGHDSCFRGGVVLRDLTSWNGKASEGQGYHYLRWRGEGSGPASMQSEKSKQYMTAKGD